MKKLIITLCVRIVKHCNLYIVKEYWSFELNNYEYEYLCDTPYLINRLRMFMQFHTSAAMVKGIKPK